MPNEKTSLFNLVIVDSCPDPRVPKHEKVIVFSFRTSMTDPQKCEKAARAAVREYLSTGAGQKDVKTNNDWFNWGDAVVCVPSKIWDKHGLSPVYGNTLDNIVDHDENLALESGD